MNIHIIHPLPPASMFVGRHAQLQELNRAWIDPHTRLVSLIGMGGAGKTAIAKHFLDDLLKNASAENLSVFVWSFYADQDAGNFLKAALQHVTADAQSASADLALLGRLEMALKNTPQRTLLVLDGLERVQRENQSPRGGLTAAFGELQDPLLKQMLVRIAQGGLNAKCLITTRFPVTDVAAWAGDSYLALHLDSLTTYEGVDLLRRRGVHGTDDALLRLTQQFGTHALTLDRLGVYLARFCEGDPSWASAVPDPETDAREPQEAKLARVLQAYQRQMDPLDLALLCRICVFRFGTTLDSLFKLLKEPAASARVAGPLAHLSRVDFDRIAQRLVELDLLQQDSQGILTAHAAVRDYFYRLFVEAPDLHAAASAIFMERLGFKSENVLRDLRMTFLQLCRRLAEPDSQGRTYRNAPHRHPQFRDACDEMAIAIRNAFISAPEAMEPLRPEMEDLLIGLQAYSENCFAPMSFDISLTQMPSKWVPTSNESLDLMEELIFHTLQAGQASEALSLYKGKLGGRENLGKRLGQYTRGLRILGYFPDCPEWLDLAWYLRGAGELERARQIMADTRPIWEGTILCLQGRLAQVSRHHWTQSQWIADLLRGRHPKEINIANHKGPKPFLPGFGWGEALIDADYYLLRGDYRTALKVAAIGADTFTSRLSPETARCHLAAAEANWRIGEIPAAHECLKQAEEWVLQSGSAEHTLLVQLQHGRLAAAERRYEEALDILKTGLRLARACGFSIYHADLAIAAADVCTDINTRPSHQQAHDLYQTVERGIGADGNVPPTPAANLSTLQIIGAAHPVCRYATALNWLEKHRKTWGHQRLN